MTQEEKELLLKDLSARLPYGVICQMEDEMRFINEKSPYYDYILSERHLGYLRKHKGFYIKPYLRPMSSMTEEERKEYNEYLFYGASIGLMSNTESAYELIDWLNKKMFDFRNLIEYGLAIAVTEKNNPYK